MKKILLALLLTACSSSSSELSIYDSGSDAAIELDSGIESSMEVGVDVVADAAVVDVVVDSSTIINKIDWLYYSDVSFDNSKLPEEIAGNFASKEKFNLNLNIKPPISFMFRVKRFEPVGNSLLLASKDFSIYFTGGYGGVVVDINKTQYPSVDYLDYGDHIIGYVNDSFNGSLYIDGEKIWEFPQNNLNLADIEFFNFDGWWQSVGVTQKVLTQSEILEISNLWKDKDRPHPGFGKKIYWIGDSITQGDSDIYSYNHVLGGFRYRLNEYFKHNHLAFDSDGPNKQGYFFDNEHLAKGGADIGYTQTKVEQYLQPSDFAFLMIGTNEVHYIENGSRTLNSVLSKYEKLLKTILNMGVKKVGVSTILPIQPGVIGAKAVVLYNDGIKKIWDQVVLEYGNVLIRADIYTEMGGKWDSKLFKDLAHPNYDGYNLIGNFYWLAFKDYLLLVGK